MKYRLLLFVLLISYLSACKKGEYIGQVSLYTDSIVASNNLLELNPPMRKGSVNFRCIVDSISYLPLFTNDSILIANISDVKVLNDTLFIADYQLGKIFAFNFKGKCIGTISAKGEGPEQYKRLCGFDIDAHNHLLYLLDGDLGEVHIYTSAFDLCDIIKLPYSFVDHISLYQSNKLFLELGFRDYNPKDKISPNLILYNLEEKQVDSTFFHYKHTIDINYRMQDPISFSSYKNSIYYWPPLSHSVYLYDGIIQKIINCNFGEYELPNEIFLKKNSTALNCMREKKYAYIDRFFEFKDWYYLRISRVNSSAHYFYNKNTQKGFLDVSFLKFKTEKEVIMPDLYAISDTVCCSYMYPDQYINLLKEQSINDFMDIEDNPILVFYKLKP